MYASDIGACVQCAKSGSSLAAVAAVRLAVCVAVFGGIGLWRLGLACHDLAATVSATASAAAAATAAGAAGAGRARWTVVGAGFVLLVQKGGAERRNDRCRHGGSSTDGGGMSENKEIGYYKVKIRAWLQCGQKSVRQYDCRHFYYSCRDDGNVLNLSICVNLRGRGSRDGFRCLIIHLLHGKAIHSPPFHHEWHQNRCSTNCHSKINRSELHP